MKSSYRLFIVMLFMVPVVNAQRMATVGPTRTSDVDDQYWDDRFFEPYVGSVNAFVKIGTSVYIGGANITKWDGQKFQIVGGGVSGNVFCLATDGTNLYVGGDFTAAGGNSSIQYLAKWDGGSWSGLGAGVNGAVKALAYWNSNLYAAGSFTSAGGLGSPSKLIARWNGASWDSLGGNRFTAPDAGSTLQINALWVANNKLYVGGAFKQIGTKLCNGIAAYNGSSYDSLGTAGGVGIAGGSNKINAITNDGLTIYVGGDFTSAGGVSAKAIARWTGSAWDSLRGGLTYGNSPVYSGYCYSLAVLGGNLYAGGLFGRAGSVAAADLGRWDGNSWNTVLDVGFSNFSAPSSFIYALYSDGVDLYIGGDFQSLGPNIRMPMVGRWNGTRFYTLGNGFASGNGPQAMIMNGTSVLVSGYFGGVGGVGGNLAQWEGTEWTGLNANTNGTISAMIKVGSDIYIGGNFTRLNGDTAYNVAHWNGSSWLRMGEGLGGSVTSLAYRNGKVYAGGNFTQTGDYLTTVNYIAQWDGSQWSPMGTGMNAYVQALAVANDTLYAGGGFTTAGGVSVSFMAKWDGSSWSKVGISGNGVNNSVYTLVGVSSDLYVGGYFTAAGGVSANSIAKWNGSQWTAYGSGIKYLTYGQGSVYGIALRNNQLVVGGDFQTIVGSDTLFNMAYWDGVQWKKMGSGLRNGYVSAITATNDKVFAGGTFTTAGGKVSNLFAVWNLAAPAGDLTPPAAPSGLVATDSSSKTITIKWQKSSAADFLRYRLYRGTSPAPVTKVDSTTAGVSDTARTFTGLTNGTRYYIRVTAVDSSGNESGYSNEVNAAPADRVGPTAPQNLAAVDSSSNSIGIKWRKNTEPDFLRYRVYRGTSPGPTTKVDSTTGGITDTTKTLTGLTNGTRYYIRVTAVDSAGNESGYSNEVNAVPADRVAPAAPQTLAVVDSSGSKISIKWRKNTEPDFMRYRIYRGTAPAPTTKVDSTTGGISDTSKTFTSLINGTRYYLRVTAIDSAGNESAYSNEVNAAPNAASGVDDILSQIPREYSLLQNYPNPFNPSTVIRYGLPERSNVKLEIYDMLGRRIAFLTDQEQSARFYETTWNADVPTGIYFYRISAVATANPERSFVQVRKMILLR